MPSIASSSNLSAPAFAINETGGGKPTNIENASKKTVAIFLLRYAFIEFVAVATIAFLTSLSYSEFAWAGLRHRHAYIVAALLLAAAICLISLSLKHYAAFQTRPSHTVLWNAATAVVLAFSILLSTMFLLKVTTDYSRAAFFLQLITVTITVIATRAIAHTRVRDAIAIGHLQARRVVIIGNVSHHGSLASRLDKAGMHIVRIVPFPSINLAIGRDIVRAQLRRMIDDCRAVRPDDIILATSSADLPRSARLAEYLAELPVSVHMSLIDASQLLESAQLGELGTLVTVQLVGPPMSAVDRVIKRSFDITASGLGLLLLAPMLLLVSIAIKLDSNGPVLFRQLRHGFNNSTMRVFKFRTMTATEEGTAFTQATKNDPRVTRVGRVLRQTNIDELPQLFNVLRGEMSVVGPRPHPIAMNLDFERHISPLSRRHNVKPGITGWAQVNGFRGETDTLEKMQRRFDCDIHYIENWSFILDLKIILMTVFSKAAYKNAF